MVTEGLQERLDERRGRMLVLHAVQRDEEHVGSRWQEIEETQHFRVDRLVDIADPVPQGVRLRIGFLPLRTVLPEQVGRGVRLGEEQRRDVERPTRKEIAKERTLLPCTTE